MQHYKKLKCHSINSLKYLSVASIDAMLAFVLPLLARLCANSSNDAVAGVVGVSDDLSE